MSVVIKTHLCLALRRPFLLHSIRGRAWGGFAQKLRAPLAAVLILAWVTGCASPAAVEPIPDLGSSYTLEKDEQDLWNQSRDEERKLREKLRLVNDPLLQSYVDDLGQRVVESSTRSSGQVNFSFHVVDDPTLNGFAFPHGSIYVHSGLVARTESEAQLAMVLGHEVSHVEGRHALKHQRSAKRRAFWWGAAAVTASIIVAHEAGERAERGDYSGAYVINQTANIILGVGLQLAFIASVQGYGRKLERSADETGMAKLVEAGYDPREAPKLFALLLQEHPDPGKMEQFFFANHPANEERERATKELLADLYAEQAGQGEVSSPGYDLRRRRVVRSDARLNIEAGRLELAEQQIEQVLEATPDDPVALALRGDLYKRRAANAQTPEDKRAEEAVALESYLESIDSDPDYALPRREAGLILMRQGEAARAREQLERYLKLAPDAGDAQVIRDYLLELGTG